MSSSTPKPRATPKLQVLITDPCYVKSEEEYTTLIADGVVGRPDSKEPGHYVPVPVTPTFFQELSVRVLALESSNYIWVEAEGAQGV